MISLANLRRELANEMEARGRRPLIAREEATHNREAAERMRERSRKLLRRRRSPVRSPRKIVVIDDVPPRASRKQPDYIRPQPMRSPSAVRLPFHYADGRRPTPDPSNPFRRTHGFDRPMYPSDRLLSRERRRVMAEKMKDQIRKSAKRSARRRRAQRVRRRSSPVDQKLIDDIRARTEARARARESEDLTDKMKNLMIADGSPPPLSLPPPAASPPLLSLPPPAASPSSISWDTIWKEEERQQILDTLDTLTKVKKIRVPSYNRFMGLTTLKSILKEALRQQQKKEDAEKKKRDKAWPKLKKQMKKLKNRMRVKAAERRKKAGTVENPRKKLARKIKALIDENAKATTPKPEKPKLWVLKNKHIKKAGESMKTWEVLGTYYDESSGEDMMRVRSGNRTTDVPAKTFMKKHEPLETRDAAAREASASPPREAGRGAEEFRLQRRTHNGKLQVQSPENENSIARGGRWYVAHGKIGRKLIAKYER